VRSIHEEPNPSCVTALFADRALFFVLPKGATLEDLAGRLASLHVGTPIAINVRLDSATRRQIVQKIKVDRCELAHTC
jgi:hypothetical protein